MRPLSELQEREVSRLLHAIAEKIEASPAIRAGGPLNAAVAAIERAEGILHGAARSRGISLAAEGRATEDQALAEFGLTKYLIRTRNPRAADLLGLRPSAFEQAEAIRALSEAPFVDREGNIWGLGKYEQLDLGWALAGVYYLATIAEVIGKAKWGNAPARLAHTSRLTLALAGDWGTGQWNDGGNLCPALQVRAHLLDQKPDYTIHLGDVYYAGTDNFLLWSGEELDNFVDFWPSGAAGALTLNSNHEMYDAGNGYFNRALGSKTFGVQGKTSFFTLETSDWIVAGLDTGYFDQSAFFSAGALVDPDQIKLLTEIGRAKKKVLLLSHHNGLSFDGTQTTPLWDQVTKALGRQPDMWYWGHLHNGIVYSASSAAGSAKARCCGHGGLPFGRASALVNGGTMIPSVEYYSSEQGIPAYRVLNGYAVLSIEGANLTEAFYDQNGNKVWPQP